MSSPFPSSVQGSHTVDDDIWGVIVERTPIPEDNFFWPDTPRHVTPDVPSPNTHDSIASTPRDASSLGLSASPTSYNLSPILFDINLPMSPCPAASEDISMDNDMDTQPEPAVRSSGGRAERTNLSRGLSVCGDESAQGAHSHAPPYATRETNHPALDGASAESTVSAGPSAHPRDCAQSTRTSLTIFYCPDLF